MLGGALIMKGRTKSSADALSSIKGDGFDVPAKPRGHAPSIPSDITDLGDEELMSLFAEYTAWQDYASSYLALTQIDERYAQRALDHAQSSAMMVKWAGKSSDRVAVAKAAAAEDPDVVSAHEELDRRYALRKVMESLCGNLERDAFLVSRELTRRVGESGSKSKRSRWSV